MVLRKEISMCKKKIITSVCHVLKWKRQYSRVVLLKKGRNGMKQQKKKKGLFGETAVLATSLPPFGFGD